MPRSIRFSVPAHRTDALVADLREIEPLGLNLLRGASLEPVGDVVEVDVSNAHLVDVMAIADDHGLRDDNGGLTMSSSVPLSIVGPGFVKLTREPGNASWEELELTMAQESTMTADKVIVMFIAGVVAGVGILSGAIHVVIGAMVIAPGFQPFARVMLGLMNRSPALRGGLIDVSRGYGALLGGAALAGLLSRYLGDGALDAGGGGDYLPAAELIDYWTTITWAGITVGAVAGIAGGLLMSINRTVLTAGVMVALALVPTVALVPIAIVAGDIALAGDAAVRFLVEVALVLCGSTLVFVRKRSRDRRTVIR